MTLEETKIFAREVARADRAEERLAAIDVGCFNCGGLPHTTDCKVRDAKALLARAEKAKQEWEALVARGDRKIADAIEQQLRERVAKLEAALDNARREMCVDREFFWDAIHRAEDALLPVSENP